MLKKFIIGIFAVIGLLSVIVVLVGAGYFLGKNNNIFGVPTEEQVTSADNKTADDNASADNNVAVAGTEIAENASSGTASATDNASGEKSQTPTPTQPSKDTIPPDKTEFTINAEDYYLDENNKIVYSDELVDFIKSFEAFDDLTTEQVEKIIMSSWFKDNANYGILTGSLQWYLEFNFEDSSTTNYLLRYVVGINTQYDIPEDNNLGGSDDNEVVDGDGYHAVDGSQNAEPDSGNSKLNQEDYDNILTEEEIGEDPNKPATGDDIVHSETSQYTFESVNIKLYLTDTVNYRIGPSTDFEKLGEFPFNGMFKATVRCNETGWYGFMYKQQMVYVSDKFVSETPATTTPSATPTATPTQTPTQSGSETSKPTETPVETPVETPAPTPTIKPTQNKTVTSVDGETVELGKTYTKTFTITYFKLDSDAKSQQDGKKVTETLTLEGKYYTGKYFDTEEVWFVPYGLEDSYDTYYLTPCQADAWSQYYTNCLCTQQNRKISSSDAEYESGDWKEKYNAPHYDYNTIVKESQGYYITYYSLSPAGEMSAEYVPAGVQGSFRN